jgi:predicted CopG family antitoxin
MLKTIKVKQEVYDALEILRKDKETKGECIHRLIRAYSALLGIAEPKQEEGKA